MIFLKNCDYSTDVPSGALAMESLHRQVLPFLLRRLKEDVLQDLPPKIMQDYYCDLSPLQVTYYQETRRRFHALHECCCDMVTHSSRCDSSVMSFLRSTENRSGKCGHIFPISETSTKLSFNSVVSTKSSAYNSFHRPSLLTSLVTSCITVINSNGLNTDPLSTHCYNKLFQCYVYLDLVPYKEPLLHLIANTAPVGDLPWQKPN